MTHAFHPFLNFYFPAFSAQIDWRQRPRFHDKEFAGLGFGSAPDVMVADLLVEVCLRAGHTRVLVHIEIQAQRDAALARRVRHYNNRIDEAYGLPVVSLVLLADADPHWRPSTARKPVCGSATGFNFTTAKLLDFAADPAVLEASDNPIAWVTLVHLRTLQDHHDADKRYAAKLHVTKLLFQHGWNRKRILVLFNVANWMMALPEPYQRRYWKAVLRMQKERDMELLNPLEQMFLDDGIKKGMKQGLEKGLQKGLEKGLQKGRQEGRQEGLERGRTEGAVALLERLLIQRFGPLPQTVHRRLAKASLAQVEAWSDALVTAQSLRQVFK